MKATDGGRTRIPMLITKRENGETWSATTNKQKAKMLFEMFFPAPSDEPVDTEDDHAYPPSTFKFLPVSNEQIRREIGRLNPFKAPGTNGIPNVVLKQCVDTMLTYLGPLFRDTFTLETYPSKWRDLVTKVIQKPGKPSYGVPGAYRPIAFLDTIRKVLSSCITEDLMKMAEKKNPLPKNHFGCQLGRASTDALHYVVAAAKDAWRKGKVLGALFLDIKGAFPSIVLKKLIHDMQCRGIPKEYTDWIKRKVEHRCTVTALDDYVTAAMEIPWGPDQGCPLSGVAYQFYSTDLIETSEKSNSEDCIGFIDDTTIMAEGMHIEEVFKKLESVMTRQGGALD